MRTKILSADQLGELIAEAGDLPTQVLRKKWKEILRQSAPDALNGKLLSRAFAHGLQQKIHGGLSLVIKKRLQAALQQMEPNASSARRQSHPENAAAPESAAAKESCGRFGCKSGAPNSVPVSIAARIPNRTLCAGTRLLREWHGINHEVIVLPDGFLWNGKVHASLSAIARELTGVRWNGWIFFGLKQRQKKSAVPARCGQIDLEKSDLTSMAAVSLDYAHEQISRRSSRLTRVPVKSTWPDLSIDPPISQVSSLTNGTAAPDLGQAIKSSRGMVRRMVKSRLQPIEQEKCSHGA